MNGPETSKQRPLFIRHKLCITSKLMGEFFQRRLIAVHFNDLESWNPNDYDRGKSALRVFNEIDDTGGWVIADYPQLPEKKMMLIGSIKHGSKSFEMARERCEEHREHGEKYGPIHRYKVLQLENAEPVSPDEYPLLRLPIGRGTVFRTEVITLKNLILMHSKKSLDDNVRSLHPTHLEILCQEYLRKFFDPRLEFLLDIGRQLRDIDIIGEDSKSHKILAQVSQTVSEEKKEKLERHRDPSSILVYFGPTNDQGLKNQFRYVDINEVFETMKADTVGSKMIGHFLGRQSATFA